MTKRFRFTALGLLVGFGLLVVPAQGQQYVATTFAGVPPGLTSTTSALSALVLTIGDGSAPTEGTMMAPVGVSYVNGNLFVLENAGQRVRLVNSTLITTVGGFTDLSTTMIGNTGYSGDGASANGSTAAFNFPQGIAVDAAANVYVADTNNYVIRKFNVTGNLSTIAGIGGSSGYGGDGGTATAAQLLLPHAVALDSAGNLYIADGNRIRKLSGGKLTTIAGAPTSGFYGDGGQAIYALLNSPQGLTVDSAGNLYIADTFNSRIRKIAPSGIITTIAGTGVSGFSGDGGQALAAQFLAPTGVAIDATGALYVAEHSRVRKIFPNGVITTIAGTGIEGYSGDGNLATGAQVMSVYGITLDPAGNVYVADSGNNIVRKFSPVAAAVATNGASNIQGAVAPGEIVTLYGTNLASDPIQFATVDTSVDPRGYIDNSLNGVQVSFDGYYAPVLYASSKQIAVIAPYAIAGFGGATAIQVINNGTTTAAFTTNVVAAAPEIFTTNGTGSGQAAALNQNGTLNSAANPASAGQAVVLYVTGEGLTSPLNPDGLLNQSGYTLPKPILPVTATVGGVAVGVEYAGGSPGQVTGVMQLNLRLPAGIPTGNVAVKVTVGTTTSLGNVTIAIK